jgi:hypothetical protein
MLAALWLAPLFARTVPQATLVPVAVPLMLAAFAMILRTAFAPSAATRLANAATAE